MASNKVASEIHQYYKKCKTLTDEDAQRMLAKAILIKIEKAKLMKKWKSKEWVKELQQFVTQTEP